MGKSMVLFFGSPDVFRLRKEPINSLSCVRACVRACVSSGPTALTVRYFFYFLHEVVSPYDLDDHQKFYRSKNFLTPKMAKNGQIFVLHGQNFAKSEFSKHIEYDFLKKYHKNKFHTKKLGRLIAAFGSYSSKSLKAVNFGQKWPLLMDQISPYQNFPSI